MLLIVQILLVLTAEFRKLLLVERSHPEAFADDVWFGLKTIFGAGFKEAQKTFDNHSGRVLSFKID